MTKPVRAFKFSGVVAPSDALHRIVGSKAVGGVAPDETYIAPTVVHVNITVPTRETIGVPQYSPTVIGDVVASYNPAGDCQGNFMSYKYQPNNNCYAYGCNITTNTFPQPGRCSGYLLTAANFQGTVDQVGQIVAGYAVNDGLINVGTSMADVLAFQKAKLTAASQQAAGSGSLTGHFVALMISPAGDSNWPGDYHWARCDNSSGACDSWSQKDGGDQVTNFDFAGNPITDPSTANWTVNQGPISQGSDEYTTEYAFYCYMFVPFGQVNII